MFEMGSLGLYARPIFLGAGVLIAGLVVLWVARVCRPVESFLASARGLLSGAVLRKGRVPPFYIREEVKGIYKGRDVCVGIVFSGFKGEFLPLPLVRMRLREVIGYNSSRLPNYAKIDKNFIVYKPAASLLWGVFDRGYPLLFSDNYLSIALEKLLATAEDVERGRTINELYK